MSDTPRGRFVEAMKVLAKLPGYQNAKVAACEAFADAECGGRGFGCCKWPTDGCEDRARNGKEHASCRAALVKEVVG